MQRIKGKTRKQEDAHCALDESYDQISDRMRRCGDLIGSKKAVLRCFSQLSE